MKTESLISVIIPLYNESGNIDVLCKELISELKKLGRPYEVIFIDDGSTDNTAEKLTAWAKTNEQLKLLSFKRNVGQTAAMMAGIDNAKGDIFIPMDGDLQSDPAEIQNLLAKLNEGFDVVSGWRQNRRDSFWSRVLPSKIANAIISFVSGVYLKDYGCTQKAYRREVLEGFRLYGEMHRFVPIYANWQGAKITEIPVNHRKRHTGKSKYGSSRVFKVLLDLIVVKFLTQYESKPIYIFGIVGFSFFGISFVAGFYSLYLKYFKSIPFVETPLPLLFTLGFITGVMCILLGLLAEIMIRVYFESQGKLQYTIRERINIDNQS
ncbi:MAG: glycosyltransferase [Rhodospirillaceae bacterium]|nr:glycosyltransferase [Rhodospirillaceae bacterium]|tara:strand:- start:1994 stop:2959 length:966 start_codon:yes stop_codon:yes gene_type:complete